MKHALRVSAFVIVCAMLAMVVQPAIAGSTITDTTSGTATRDGTVNVEEYVGSTPGINSGFGGVIGADATLHIDSSSAGAVNIGLIKGSGSPDTNMMVIYIDVDGGGSGYSGTGGFTDSADGCRKAISGYDGANRATLNFAPGFKADYAICWQPSASYVGLFKLVAGGPHTWVVNPAYTAGAGHYEMEFTLADLGLGPGSSFDYVATYISTTAYRSNEFNGVAAYGGGNPDLNPVSLVAGDFNTFRSAAGEVTPLNNGGAGPGGVGVPDGSSSLELWLRAGSGVYEDVACTDAAEDTDDVACWKDQSGNGRSYTQSTAGNRPNYIAAGQNGLPVIRFNNSAFDYLANPGSAGAVLAAGDDTFSYFSAWKTNGTTTQVVFEQNHNAFATGRRAALLIIGAAGYGFNGESNDYHSAAPFTAGQYEVSSIVFTGIPANNILVTGKGTEHLGTINATTENVGVDGGTAVGHKITTGGEPFNGDIPEVIVFSDALPAVERVLVENSLSSRYAVAMNTNDVYDGDTTGNGEFDLDVAGIGRAGGVTHPQAHAAGMIVRNATFLQDDGDWLLFGHRTAANATVTTDLPTTGDWVGKTGSQRMERHFYIDLTDASGVTGGTVDLIFDFGDAGLAPWNLVTGNYRLLKRSGTTGAFSDIATASAVVGDQVHFYGVNVSVLGSNFTLGGVGEPTAVTLTRFAATPAGDGVQVTWETAQELEHLGFNLYRGSSSTGPWVRLNAELLPAQNPGATSGGTYTWLDTGATPGAPSFYRLEDVDIHGVSTFHGPVAATPEGPAAISIVGLGTRAPLGGFALLALGTAALVVLRARQKPGTPD
ncbi:MAG: hypothetical protein BWY63_02842 [Chloroflexi bacterium ADurb.Bin360]|nr:MAG: hypothetical protein BWY63_02842 [Chloroflexi bacterium ADurb.Bin360]